MPWYADPQILNVIAASASAVVAFVSLFAAFSSVSAAKLSHEISEKILHDQSAQTHRANLKNLCDISNGLASKNLESFKEDESIKTLYRCLYRAAKGLDDIPENIRGSLAEYFFLNLEPLIQAEINSGDEIKKIMRSQGISAQQHEKWKQCLIEINVYFPVAPFP